MSSIESVGLFVTAILCWNDIAGCDARDAFEDGVEAVMEQADGRHKRARAVISARACVVQVPIRVQKMERGAPQSEFSRSLGPEREEQTVLVPDALLEPRGSPRRRLERRGRRVPADNVLPGHGRAAVVLHLGR